jgi:hypothetical protein
MCILVYVQSIDPSRMLTDQVIALEEVVMQCVMSPDFRACLSVFAGIALLGGLSCASAHDIWVTTESEHDGKVIAIVKYGDVAARDVPDPKKVVVLTVLGGDHARNLRWTLVPGQRGGQPVLVSAPFDASSASMIAVSYDNGYWTTSPDDNPEHHEANTSKLLIPNGKPSYWVPKFSKTLLRPGAYRLVTHTELELVPLKDPLAIAPGSSLPVQMIFRGKPIKGVPIAYGDGLAPIPDDKMPTVITDSNGVALVPLERKGPYLLTADYDGAPVEPSLSDQDEPYASLAFDLSGRGDHANGMKKMQAMPGMKGMPDM